jgi:hypothetical protein
VAEVDLIEKGRTSLKKGLARTFEFMPTLVLQIQAKKSQRPAFCFSRWRNLNILTQN